MVYPAVAIPRRPPVSAGVSLIEHFDPPMGHATVAVCPAVAIPRRQPEGAGVSLIAEESTAHAHLRNRPLADPIDVMCRVVSPAVAIPTHRQLAG